MDPHKEYERRLAKWLGFTYVAIGMVTAALVIYCAFEIGLASRLVVSEACAS